MNISKGDHTILTDRTLPKTWICPHCGQRNITGIYANDILMEHFRYLEHCGCGYVHSWELILTDDFKRKVVSMLLSKSGKEQK